MYNLILAPIHETSQDAENWECFRSGIHFLRSQPITSRINSDPDKDVVDHYVVLTKDPNPYDDTTVGIAFRGSACVAKGKLLFQTRKSRFASVVTSPFLCSNK